MKIESLVKSAISKWDNKIQLLRTSELFPELAAQVVVSFSISFPRMSIEESQYALACKIVNCEMNLSALSIMFNYPYDIPSLNEPNILKGKPSPLGDGDIYRMIKVFSTGPIASVRYLENVGNKKYLDDWFLEAVPEVNSLKPLISPEIYAKALRDRSLKFANNLS